MALTQHPSIDALREFYDGRASRKDSTEIESHLSACERCTTLLSELQLETPIIQAIRQSVNADPKKSTVEHNAESTGDFAPTQSVMPNVTGDYHSIGATRSLSVEGQNLDVTLPSGTKTSTSRTGSKSDMGSPDRLDDYEILSELGHGGMGVVYKAKQKKLNRLVALKMVLAGARAKPTAIDRFRKEAQAVAKLDHANIVQIYDIGEHDDLPFFSMEYVDGGSLEKLMDHKPMEPQPAARYIATIARAMHYAHAKGVVHRDLKPANILLTKDRSPKVTDFGLARQFDSSDEEGASAGTRTGAIMGTPNYMSPEQAEGNTKYADHLADVYSLGATLYEMLTGRPPFAGPSVASILSQVRDTDPVAPSLLQPNIPKDIQTITLKCLQKDPAKRYSTAEALAEDLERFMDGRTIIARPVSTAEKFVRWCRRNRAQAAASILAALLAVGLVVTILISNFQLQKKNAEITKKSIELAQETQAAESTSDGLYQTIRKLRQVVEPELSRLGLTRQRNEMMAILNEGTELVERATPAGAEGLERVRVMNLRDLALQYMQPSSTRPGTWDERLEIAEQKIDQAIRLAETLQAKPDAGDLARANLALNIGTRGDIRARRNKPKDGLADLQTSIELFQANVDTPRSEKGAREYIHPANALRNLSAAYRKLGVWQQNDPQLMKESAASLEKAVAIAEKAVATYEADPKNIYEADGGDRFRTIAAEAYLSLATAVARENLKFTPRPNSTVQDVSIDPTIFEKVVGLLTQAFDSDPLTLRNPAFANDPGLKRPVFVELLRKNALSFFKAGDYAKAKKVWECCAELQRPVISYAPEADKIKHERDAAFLLYGIGSAELKLKSTTKAKAAFDECVSINRRLYSLSPETSSAIPFAVALARSGRGSEAIKLMQNEIERIDDPTRKPLATMIWYNTACVYSLAAETLDGMNTDGTPKSNEQLVEKSQPLRATYLKLATEAIDKLKALNSPRLKNVDTEPDLEFWRNQQSRK